MSTSQLNPLPFGRMRLGREWDGTTYPPINCFGVGDHPIGLTFEQLQRWHCRLGVWDAASSISDSFGLLDNMSRDFGDPAFDDGARTYHDRRFVANDWVMLVGDGTSLDFALTISIIWQQRADGMLTNSDQTLFYPAIIATGNTFLVTDVNGFHPLIQTRPDSPDWVLWGIWEISDGVDVFQVPLYMETPPGGWPGHRLIFYEPDFIRSKPTLYLGDTPPVPHDEGDAGDGGDGGDAGTRQDSGDIGDTGTGDSNPLGDTGGLTSGGLDSGGLTSGGLTSGGLTSSGLNSGGLTSGGLSGSGLTSGGLTSGGLDSGGLTGGGLASGGLTSGGLAGGGLTSGGLSGSGLISGGL